MSKRTTDAAGALAGRHETDPRGVSVERPNNPQPLFRSGGGGGERLPGGDEFSLNPASLMDARTCDFGQMLVPCGLVESFEARVSGLSKTEYEFGRWGLWDGAGYGTMYLHLSETSPGLLIDFLQWSEGKYTTTRLAQGAFIVAPETF